LSALSRDGEIKDVVGDSLDVGPFAGPWLEDEAADDTEFALGEASALAEEDLELSGAGGRRLRRDIFRW
jgi:hypothetical protein